MGNGYVPTTLVLMDWWGVFPIQWDAVPIFCQNMGKNCGEVGVNPYGIRYISLLLYPNSHTGYVVL